MKANIISMTGSCPRCGESIDISLSKSEIKEILRGFKLGNIANILAEKRIELSYRKEATEHEALEEYEETLSTLKVISERSGYPLDWCLKEAVKIYAETLAQNFV
ncbi:MAG: hypothetical protein V1850_00310 [Candidatus Bathyarchaeota archaeon]